VDWSVTVYHHAYPLACVAWFLGLVLSAAASLRGAGRAIETSASVLGLSLGCPAWSTGRLWLLRLGYYKLVRPKVQADDWVWIVDYTVQWGQEKCLVILGVRLCDLPPAGRCLSHAEVEPLELVPVRQSNGQVVYQQLTNAVAKTGVPRDIISDHGTDLNAGISLFCAQHPETSPIYDIKHKTAAVLKHELEHDADWLRFSAAVNQTTRRVQQTALAALAPPHPKTKARYLNLAELVRWGQTMLALLDQPQSQWPCAFEPALVQAKLGWLQDFRSHLAAWAELFELLTSVESFVRQQGLYAGAQQELQTQLYGRAQSPRAQRVCHALLSFVAEEESKARPDERLLGSSEVIESLLGKMKRLEQDQAKNGFTGLILGLSAMVSTTTKDVIQKALETVSTQKVLAWCQATLGQTVQAKRRKVFACLGKAEQKRDQLQGAT